MDLLLIDPPYTTLKNTMMDVGYNIGLTSLAAYVRREGFDTSVLMGDMLVDLSFTSTWGWFSMNLQKYAEGQRNFASVVGDKNHPVWKKLADKVRQANPKAIGIQYLTPSTCAVDRITELVKDISKDIKVIAGSAHPTLCPEEVMRDNNIDFVIRGEGEIPLLGLLKELRKDTPKYDSVPGIYYRDSHGHVMNTPPQGLITNLDELPFPARDAVLDCDYNKYRVHCITTARGCPYTCSFCADRRLWGGRVRRRSVANVIEEMKLLEKTYKIDSIDFSDGTFTFDRKYVEEFCDAVIANKLGVQWRCTARYDNLDEALLKRMKRANCGGMFIGLESGSERVLKAMDKKITIEQVLKVSKMVHDSGIPYATAVIVGFPDEKKEDVEATLALMKKVKTDILDVSSFVPLPGTPHWDAMSREEKDKIDWGKVGFKSLDNYFSKNLSPEDFTRYMSEAFEIAGKLRRKTVIRIGTKRVLGMGAGLFTRPFRRQGGK